MRFLSAALSVLFVLWISGFAAAEIGTVSSFQKISDVEGNFSGAIGPEQLFGYSVVSLGDLNGDGVPDLAVGTPGDSVVQVGSGSLWILFMDTDGTVASQQEISETVGNFTGTLPANSGFGLSLAAAGDLNGDNIPDLYVGDPGNAVWVLFLNSNGTVASHQSISDPGGDPFAGFGASLTVPGDLNNDGVPDLAAGAPSDDDGGSLRGAVWVFFMNTDGTVDAQQKISDTQGNFTGTLGDTDVFGGALGSPGDLNGDGIPDLLVGATGDDDGGSKRGAVWILYMNSDGTVQSHQKISDTAGNFNGTLNHSDLFGASIACPGDLNGDGVGDFVVGAASDEDGQPDTGAVWVLFMNTDETVASHKKISATQGNFGGDIGTFDEFGQDIASPGDLNGDGATDLVVGAPYDDDGGFESGAIYVLFMDGDSAIQVAVDVKPQTCPNTINSQAKGLVSIAVLGSLDLDVQNIDVSTIRVEGVAPVHFSIEDVADSFVGVPNGCEDCNPLEPTEGFSDLVMKFESTDLLNALGTITNKECRTVHLTGELNDGTPIAGSDFVVTVKKK